MTTKCGLAYYLEDVLFDEFKRNRRGPAEKVKRNEDAFDAISRGVWKPGEGEDWRSKTFLKKTKVKVITAYSMMSDMVLQGGKIPFMLKPSPLYEIPLDKMDEANRTSVEDRIRDGVRTIEQQLLECNADREAMKCMFSCAKIGETYAKKYVHEVIRRGYTEINPGTKSARWQMVQEKIISPAFAYCNWDGIYRDLETDDLQKGIGVIEKEMMSPYDLRSKEDDMFWDKKAIDKVIEANKGTDKNSDIDDDAPNGIDGLPSRHKTIRALKCWCRVPRDIVEAHEKDKLNDDAYKPEANEGDGREIEIIAVVADGEIVRYARNDGDRPYFRALWEMTLNKSEGVGVADNVEQTQHVINGLVRNLEDNLKLAASVMFATKPRAMKNWDGVVKPGMNLQLSAEIDDARKAFQQIIVQDVSGNLPNVLGMFERFLDEDGMLPSILQGAVREKQKSDTLGEINLLQQNAGKYIGGVIRNFDEGIIEPMISAFYHYNMMDPNITVGKGNFIVKALGFSSFQDRVVRLQKLMQFFNIVVSAQELIGDEYRIKGMTDEIGKALDIDPDEFTKNEDEKKAESEQREQAMAAQKEQEQAEIGEQLKLKFEFENAMKDEDHRREIEKMTAKGQIDTESKLAIEDEKFVNDTARGK